MANVEILRGKLRCFITKGQGRERCTFKSPKPEWWPMDILIQDPTKMVRGKLTNRKSENSQFKIIRSYLVMGD